MSTVEWPSKAPGDRLDFGLDYSPILSYSPGAVIDSVDAVVTPSGLTIEQPVVVDSSTVKMWISAGVAKTKYKIVVTVHATVPEDATGLTIVRTRYLFVQDL